jgi:hypothetical protein
MVNRVLIGPRADGSSGLDVSLPGFEVVGAAPANLSLSSKWGGAASIHQSGVVTTNTTISFPTLPYIPLVMVLIVNPSANSITYWQYWGPIGGDYAVDPMFDVTTSSLTIRSSPVVNGSIYRVRYIIFNIQGY